jgi:hypothetical protein
MRTLLRRLIRALLADWLADVGELLRSLKTNPKGPR